MIRTYNADQDLREAEAMANSLVPYVHQEPLYGSVGGLGFFNPRPTPSLTIGAFLMRVRRLQSLKDQRYLNDRQSQRLNKVIHRNDEVLSEWRKAYVAKMRREAKSRLKAMDMYFDECNKSPRDCASNYKPEAMRRTIVEEIFIAMETMGIEPEQETTDLARTMDSRLRRYATAKESFMLEDDIASIYPENRFWWLYHRPRSVNS